ncbi:MAG: peptidyl-prolyl cis-trans isomerase [Verrucomicrobia bacterium]|nr:peptidyl-prolyl cis-trans isomerase [Verrucomicrobiota bacterium]
MLARTAILTLLAALPLQAADPVIARAGDKDITASQVQPYLAKVSPSERDALLQNPAALSRAVRAVLLQRQLLDEAKAADWQKNPETQALLARVRDAAIAESFLESVTAVPANYPGDEEITALYESRKDSLRLPREYRLAQIFIASADDKAKAKSKADALAKQVKSGDFAALAKSNSNEPRSAAKGGEVGWLAEESIQPAIRQALTGAVKDSIAGPIELGDGFYFVKILDVREPRTATLEEVRPQLTAALRQERAALNRQAYLERLQAKSPVTINEIALPGLLSTDTKK